MRTLVALLTFAGAAPAHALTVAPLPEPGILELVGTAAVVALIVAVRNRRK